MEVLDKGFVEFVDFSGGDLRVVNAARVSYGNKHNKMEKGDAGLINYLMKNRHGTPFEHSDFSFHIKCPISVAREWFRHRLASYNEISGRYVKMAPEFYMPIGEAIRTQTGKAGHYKFEVIKTPNTVQTVLETLEKSYQESYLKYLELLGLGVAKELARNVLPLGLYTQFYFKLNARSLMNFLSLRNEEHAMLEIREYAKVIEDYFKDLMPCTHEAFIKNGRVAP